MTRNRGNLARTAAVAGVVALALTAPLSGPAEAQASRVCLPQAAALAQQLGQQYGEKLSAAGVDAGGGLVQVYSNTESGTWTIAITIPNGPTCIMSSGEGWAHEKTAELPKPGRTS